MADDELDEPSGRTAGIATGVAVATGAAIAAAAVAVESGPASPTAGDEPSPPSGSGAGGEPATGAAAGGGVRLAGLGAAAGLGGVAAVGLANAGHTGSGHGGHAHPGAGGAAAPASAGGQGSTPSAPGADGGSSGGPGGSPAAYAGPPGSTPGHAGPAPASVVPSHGNTSPAARAGAPDGHGQAPAGNHPTANDASPYASPYAAQGYPQAIQHPAGHGHAATAPAQQVRPDSTAKTPSWTQGTPPPHSGHHQGGGHPSSGSPQHQTPTSVTVPMSDAEIAAMMRDMTPAERQALIEKALADQGLLTKDGSKNWLPLPDGFYNKDSYTYTDDQGHTYQLSALGAAATVAMLSDAFAHFKADILALSNTATNLQPKADLIRNEAIPLALAFNKVDDMWGNVADIVGNSQDPNITQAKFNFWQLKNSLFGGSVDDSKSMTCTTTDGGIAITAKALDDQAISLYETASAYVEEEEKNLSQFGLHADDPRPAWERARFVTVPDKTDPNKNRSLDLAQNQAFPPGYFDPNNPNSPYYQPKR